MRPALRPWLAGCLLFASGARAENLNRERLAVTSRLATERLALSALKDKRTSVLAVIDLLQRRKQSAWTRERAVKQEQAALARRLWGAQAQERFTGEVYRALCKRLAPRLDAMYRLTRRNTLEVLLSASDFASMVWRSRALSTLLDDDARLVRETHEVLQDQHESRQRLEALQAHAGERLLLLEQERSEAEAERAEVTDLLDAVQADASQQARLVKELEGAERRLSAMIEQMARSADSAFAHLRGQLPYPVRGLVEVGYGRIVNPRFNTVTVQKGLDLRAPAGTPVSAVADGKVVYASWLRGYGNILIIDHGSGFHTLMAHLEEFRREVGDPVSTGDVVGTVGDSGSLKGAYLYFELRQAGQAVDPADWLSGL